MLATASRFLALCAVVLPLAACDGDSTGNGDPESSRLEFASVTTGEQHSCVLTSDGEAYCWGINHMGQLGLGVADTVLVTAPRKVVGGLRFRSLHAGAGRTCGVAVDGGLHCWGYTLGSAARVAVPTATYSDKRFAALPAHLYEHVCAGTTAGRSECRGYNTHDLVPRNGAVVTAPGNIEFTRVTTGATSTRETDRPGCTTTDTSAV